MVWVKNIKNMATERTASYLIELSRWGIIQGLPTKPYVASHYMLADNNIQGINNALQYAYNNNYSEAVLPRGEYAVCYPRTLNMVSHLTFNLNGSTIKVIYDSDAKSPFDTTNTSNFYKFEGTVLYFDNVMNSHLINGNIIGCRADRSYSNPAGEAVLESSYGVQFQRTSSNNSIRNCSIGAFTGDSINFISNSLNELIEFDPQFTLNTINNATGALIPATNMLTSKAFELPVIEGGKYSALVIGGTGYDRVIGSMNSKDFDMAFYRSDGSFIGKMKNQRVYTPVSIPKGAATYRFVFFNETNPKKTFNIRIIYGDIPHHNIISNCEIYGCQRGGIQGGGSHNIIEYNTIRDTGKDGSNAFLDGGTVFADPTRYCFNQEDNYGEGVIIRHNRFYGSSNGIFAGVYTISIQNNHFYNMTANGVNMYAVQHADITGNYFYNCGNNIGLMTAYMENPYIHITGNYMKGGSLGLSGAKYKVNFSNNYLVDCINMSMPTENAIFQNNIIRFTQSSLGYTLFIVDQVKDCIFENTIATGFRLDAKVYAFDGCTFDNIALSAGSRNETTLSELVTIDKSTFKNNAYLLHDTTAAKPKNLKVANCSFIDARVWNLVTNMDNVTSITFLKNCYFQINTNTEIFVSQNNSPTSVTTISLEDSVIEINNPQFVRLLTQLWGTDSTVILSLKRTSISYKGSSTPLKLVYYQYANVMKKFISADNTFTNITLPAPDSIYIGYDETKKYKQTITLTADGVNYSATIIHNLTTSEPYVYCTSSTQVIQPIIRIVDSNTIKITYTQSLSLSVTISKI
ncbi:right-handed parallel beta-helix repeat-containing protein [Paenibacillus sp. Soil750]|uniref:right-handed parallel beta-helix repeat-containing protein n=1 Tax=Paenibacillus sp. Soil750 TaxID=1736398 RepID=UPI0006FA99FA|nr:right-handed parallel beta-helix repeat-containing protein [Paenibacillus sp. Soil750]KRE75542.1 hypothetical protein ASL11_01550 [Paenibacillus sp. Soil750]